MDKEEVEALARSDLAHFIHPQYHASEHQAPVIYVRGEGVILTDAQGRQYIDGRIEMTIVVFGEDGGPLLLGAVTLEEFGLGVDPVGRKLVPVPGLLT